MNYIEALNYINDKDKYGSRLGLDSIGKLLELLGNPQKGLNYIHIAGTNGKGSTASYISSCLIKAGYKVGLFTSPYLERFNERMQISGQDIADQALGRITALVKEAADKMVEEGWEHPTTFEIVTAIAFYHFKEEKTDYVILEVGLGGRFDSTNIIDDEDSMISVITTLDYDHTDVLGNTMGEIAYQKAGIIKKNGLVVSYPQGEEALKVLRQISQEMNADFNLVELDNIIIQDESYLGSSFDFKYKDELLKDIKISMLGEYQIYNASMALTAILLLRDKGLLKIDDESIYEGLANAKWRGRLELMSHNPKILIDGAHNLQGMENLVKALELFDYNKLILGMGILGDKDYKEMIKVILPKVDKAVITEVNMPRKLDAEKLAEISKSYVDEIYVEKDIKKAVEKAISLADKDDLVVFGGSLYLIGDIRTILCNSQHSQKS